MREGHDLGEQVSRYVGTVVVLLVPLRGHQIHDSVYALARLRYIEVKCQSKMSSVKTF